MTSRQIRGFAKRFLAVWLLAAAALPAMAVDGEQVQYMGGTLPFLAAGTVGRFDLANDQELRFVTASGIIAIPYAKIDSYQYSLEFTHNLGKLTAAAVTLVRHRKMRHFYRIVYRDQHNELQTVVFQVSKQMPQTVSAVLETRSENLRRQAAQQTPPQPQLQNIAPAVASVPGSN